MKNESKRLIWFWFSFYSLFGAWKIDALSKTMKNERKRLILFWLSFYSLFGAWKIDGITLNQNKLSLFLSFFIVFDRLSVL